MVYFIPEIGKCQGLSCTTALGRFLEKKLVTPLEALWRQPRNYSQQSWARTGSGQNTQLERGKFSKSCSCLVYITLPLTISKPIRNSYIHTNTPRGAHKHIIRIWGVFSQKWLDIWQVNAMLMKTKIISLMKEHTHLKSKHLFQICSEMPAFIRGGCASGYFSHFCPCYLCCCPRELSLLQYDYSLKVRTCIPSSVAGTVMCFTCLI